MGDAKFGRLFTEADVLSIVDEALCAAWNDSEFGHGVPMERLLEWLISRAEEDKAPMKFPADEPLFLLRGQDTHALATIGAYYGLLGDGSPDEHLTAVAKAMRAFAEWQAAHPDRVKAPG